MVIISNGLRFNSVVSKLNTDCKVTNFLLIMTTETTLFFFFIRQAWLRSLIFIVYQWFAEMKINY
jgi:hypothetical protein